MTLRRKKDVRIRVPVIIIHRNGRAVKTTLPIIPLDPYSDPSLEDGDLVVPKSRKRQVTKNVKKK